MKHFTVAAILSSMLLSSTAFGSKAFITTEHPFGDDFEQDVQKMTAEFILNEKLKSMTPVEVIQTVGHCDGDTCAMKTMADADIKLMAIQELKSEGDAVTIHTWGYTQTSSFDNVRTVTDDDGCPEVDALVSAMREELKKGLKAKRKARVCDTGCKKNVFQLTKKEVTIPKHMEVESPYGEAAEDKNTEYETVSLSNSSSIKVPKGYKNHPTNNMFVKAQVFGVLMKEIGVAIYDLIEDAFADLDK